MSTAIKTNAPVVTGAIVGADLSDLQDCIPYLTQSELDELDRLLADVEIPPWTPFERQRLALESQADILFYGGAAGGGKTDLELGCALTQHTKSIIFRREFSQLKEIRERASELYTPYGKFNGQHELWRLSTAPFAGKLIEFGAVQYDGDEKKYQGRAHDLKCFDEITHFTEAQFRYLITWLRSPRKGQRKRVIAAGNPPTDAEGDWVIKFWGPWLNKLHPNPAAPGELRYFITNAKGEDEEVPGPDAVEITLTDGTKETVTPLSRTFIPSKVEDNPYMMSTGYRSVLVNLPEPLRSRMLYGNFGMVREDAEWQVIPTQWVLAAQGRWAATYGEFLVKAEIARREKLERQAEAVKKHAAEHGAEGSDDQKPLAKSAESNFEPHSSSPRHSESAALKAKKPVLNAMTFTDPEIAALAGDGIPDVLLENLKRIEELTTASRAVGVDVARGGRDRTIFTERRGVWFAQPIVTPGRQTPDGNSVILLLISHGFTDCLIQIDVTGVGTSPVDIGRLYGMKVVPMAGSEKSVLKDRSGKLGFANARAEWWWKLREDLDPELGIDLALPPDPELLADLTAPRWELTARGIQIESKDDIKDRIMRSPDKGESLVYAHAQPVILGEGYLDFYKEQAATMGKQEKQKHSNHLRKSRAMAR